MNPLLILQYVTLAETLIRRGYKLGHDMKALALAGDISPETWEKMKAENENDLMDAIRQRGGTPPVAPVEPPVDPPPVDPDLPRPYYDPASPELTSWQKFSDVPLTRFIAGDLVYAAPGAPISPDVDSSFYFVVPRLQSNAYAGVIAKLNAKLTATV